jgi:hypothetical protein
MPLTPEETRLVALVQMKLTDTYPGRHLAVDARPIYGDGWLEIAVTDWGAIRPRKIPEIVARDDIDQHPDELLEPIMTDLAIRLDRPGSLSEAGWAEPRRTRRAHWRESAR